MKIKTLMLSAGLVMALPFTAMAGDDKAEDITKALNLDDTRSEQVERIMKDYKDQYKLIKEQKEDRLEEVLTDDEMDRLKEMKKAKKKHH